MPKAPNPALSFPVKLIKSKKGKSVGFEGTGLNLPPHNTKRGALGSPSTRSSFKPLSTWKHGESINYNRTLSKKEGQ